MSQVAESTSLSSSTEAPGLRTSVTKIASAASSQHQLVTASLRGSSRGSEEDLNAIQASSHSLLENDQEQEDLLFAQQFQALDTELDLEEVSEQSENGKDAYSINKIFKKTKGNSCPSKRLQFSLDQLKYGIVASGANKREWLGNKLNPATRQENMLLGNLLTRIDQVYFARMINSTGTNDGSESKGDYNKT